MKDLRGKVVLLDFWTFSCVNCLRTLPHLKELHEKYKNHGFVLVGVHTPEFEFERDGDNVKRAVKKHDIPYPVALDSENSTWKAYGNRYWPRQALIDHRGRIAWEHTGEGGYHEMEEVIFKLLELKGEKVAKKDLAEDTDIRGYLSSVGLSPEIYAGSSRNGGLGSSGVCGADGICRYLDQTKEHSKDVLYPQGQWDQKNEFLIHTGKEGTLTLRYQAREVHCVMEGKIEVEIFLDGKLYKKIMVDGADMYTIVQTKDMDEHELKMVVKGQLKVYAFTFG